MVSCSLCGDVATVARVISLDGEVEADGCRTRVNLELVPDAAVGDLVLCHAGIALQKVDGP